MTALRRAAHGPGAIVAGLCVTLWAATTFALGTPVAARIDLTSRRGPSYAKDSIAFRPLQLALLADLLGETAGLLTPGASALPPAGGTRHEERPEQPPPPDRPVLVLDMTSDKKTVSRGDEVTYTIRVSNVGRVAADRVVLTSHIPQWTVLVSGTACHGEVARVDPSPSPGRDALCLNVDRIVAPDAPTPQDEHAVYRTVPPGGWEDLAFTVRVDRSAPRGTVIRNRAHASADNHPTTVYSNEVEVTVR
ncbi:MAG: DUF11 domain-containing protein [Acidobacteria bacterium]|nr:DUF11 domain-containing protein [Acidobacteriota bacterium]